MEAPCWSRDEDKAFENALVRFPDDVPDRWASVAAQVPGKSPGDVARHYEELIQDLCDIEAGKIAPPEYYYDDEDAAASPTGSGGGGRRGGGAFGGGGGKAREERKKGVPWTEEEHRRFLEGLEKYGKGDWRSISRNAVVTRTPTQVASHAQKYFIRLNSAGKKEKKRGSIHDITKP